ncbi:hypothetical protein [Streptomyces kaempferi]|uniref:Uncharacterized protein n=1 Tax=Streptomyces kaempferi TaxID=333725 RepID=A0ABW3XRI9_9ACTN
MVAVAFWVLAVLAWSLSVGAAVVVAVVAPRTFTGLLRMVVPVGALLSWSGQSGRWSAAGRDGLQESWRSRAVSTSYDDYGMPLTVEDSGELGKGADETCTRTWYTRNLRLVPGSGHRVSYGE